MTKSDITKKLQTLKKCGWVLYTMNSSHRMPSGMIGLPDHVLFYPRKGLTAWIEYKGHGDTMKPKQIEFKSMITGEKFFMNGTYYFTVTDKTIDDVVQFLARGCK